MRAISTFSFCIWATLASFALTSAVSAEMSAGSPKLIEKHLFDIGGGRHMNMVCIGQHSPTVVFDVGLGDHLLHWQKVQQPVSAITRACFYDRAGFGYSDPSPRPMTAENIIDDLHALLGKAGIAEPVVLVGHSIGGLYATLYTDKFPDQVAGLVLIDPSYAEQEQLNRRLTPDENRRIKAEDDKERAQIKRCIDLARASALTADDPHGCFQYAPGRTPTEKAYLADQYTKPFRYEAVISETDSFELSCREELAAARSFGDRPMIVLTAGTNPPGPNITEAEQESLFRDWKAAHDRLAARSTRGASIVVANATHFIQTDQPQAVIDAIRKVVTEVRNTR